jgi:hypothetical protein
MVGAYNVALCENKEPGTCSNAGTLIESYQSARDALLLDERVLRAHHAPRLPPTTKLSA